MTILDTFYVLFKSDTKEVDKGLEEAGKKSKDLLENLNKTDVGAGKLNSTLKDLALRGAALFGVSLSLKVLYDNIKDNVEAMAALERLAARMNTTADAIDQFIDTGNLLGLNEEATKGGLEALSRAAQDTALGMGRAKKVFEELGITVTDATGKVKPITDLMTELAAQFVGMEKGKQVRVMERLGLDPALLKLFNADLGALGKRLEDIDKAAGFNFERLRVLSGDYIKASNAMKIEVNSIFAFFEKLKSATYTEFLPIVIKGMQFLTKVAHELYEYITHHQDAVKGALIAISAAITYFLIPAAVKGAIAVATMFAPFLLVAAIVGLVIAAFALLYEDFVIYAEGGDSLMGRWLPKWEELKVKIEEVGEVLKIGWEIVKIFGKVFSAMVDGNITVFKYMSSFITEAISSSVQQWISDFKMFFDIAMRIGKAIQAHFEMVFGYISKALEFLGVKGGLKGIGEGIGDTLKGTAKTFMEQLKATSGKEAVDGAVSIGQEMLGRAGDSPINTMNSQAIQNSTNKTTNQNVNISKVEVNAPQATDAAGIGKSIGDVLGTQMKQALNNYDDGVAA